MAASRENKARDGHVSHAPAPKTLPPCISSVRRLALTKGFFEPEQYRAVLRHLPGYLQPVLTTAYITGWRISEILSRKRHHVDLAAGWIRLEPGETKNREPRMFPITPELRGCLMEQIERTRQMEKATGRVIPWLFHRDGRRIGSFRKSWRRAIVAAGCPGRLVHDCRRSAVRNLRACRRTSSIRDGDGRTQDALDVSPLRHRR